jgi:hypothetical protein
MSVAEMGLPGLVLLQRATLTNVDFGRASFDRMAPSGCLFLTCDFRKAKLDRRMLPIFKAKRRNIFRDCRFDGADMRLIDPGSSRFERCTFDGAELDGWTAATAEFIDCHFAGRVSHVRFYGKPWGPGAAELEPRRTENEFSGNDFRDAELVDVAFLMGIDVAKQRWPEGDEYIRLDRIHQRLTRGRVEILGWKDIDARRDGLEMTRTLSFLYMQQNDVVTRREDPQTSVSPEVQAKVWDALANAL